MPGNTFLTNDAGLIREVRGLQASAGAGDAGKIPALDAAGRLDPTMMPTGVAADVAMMAATEALSAGEWVNVWEQVPGSKIGKARKADASTSGKEAMGFVKASVASGAVATVYFEGPNDQVTGQTPGTVFLSAATPGAGTSTPPSGSGNVVQRIGFAVSATCVNFQAQPPVVLA